MGTFKVIVCKCFYMVDVECFKREIECIYKGEHYSVRDNGAVFRHPREDKRFRKYDGFWTFGKPNEMNGYMEIASVRVHLIVATAFHGEKSTKGYVVDHIDTNRRNNRPDNLRWVTRLENALENPITRKRIILRCGSVEAFLANPSMLRENDVPSDFSWMRTVTDAEAQVSRERLLAWAESDKQVTGGGLGEWLYDNSSSEGKDADKAHTNLMQSLTAGAVQEIYFHNDKPNEYPCTPQEYSGDPLVAYAENLKEDAVFWRNQKRDREYVVVKYGFSEDKKSLYVMSKSAYVWKIQPDGDSTCVPIAMLKKDEYREDELNYQLGEVIYQDGLFVHKRVVTGFMPKTYLEELFEKEVGKIL
ncbi:MAG: HNH endonuclease [Bacteroides sp.]|nr:HNH endonuclease [Bacteroides sp.]